MRVSNEISGSSTKEIEVKEGRSDGNDRENTKEIRGTTSTFLITQRKDYTSQLCIIGNTII